MVLRNSHLELFMQPTRSRLNVASRLAAVTEAQAGYFTRAQAASHGVADFELDRATDYEQVERLDVGVYRLVGAPADSFENLRVAWLRLAPAVSPIDRIIRPTLWVSHRSAAIVHGFGDFIADRPEFTATKRLQARIDARITVRRNGLSRTDWVVREGFAVTSAGRTFADLVADVVDGGHLGRFAQDALIGGATHDDLADAVDDLDALLAMAAK